MKKTTLISTLAMVVIVALALTTATFAWYSANTQVTAQTTATAATATSSNLAIGTTAAGSLTSLDLTAVTAMTPAAPTSSWKATAPTNIKAATDVVALLKTATVNAENKFTSDPTAPTVLTADFFVINKAESGAAAIVPKVTLTTETVADADADGTELLRVAIFTIAGEGDSAVWTYKETLANTASADVTFGTIVKGESANYTTDDNTTQMDKFAAATNTVLDSLSAGSNVHIGIVAWFDGSGLVNTNSGAACKFTLTFAENK